MAGGVVRSLALIPLLAACGAPPPSTASPASAALQPALAAQAAAVARDTNPDLIPTGLGTLKEADISITLQLPTGVRVTMFPAGESVIRTLAPDSYRGMHATIESRAAQIRQRAAMRGERSPSVWFVRFYGLAPDARYDPMDITVSVGGRNFRPFDVIPVSGDLGTQSIQPRETKTGLLLFDGSLDAGQPMVVQMGAEQSTDWDYSGGILGKVEAERAAVRARASAKALPAKLPQSAR